MDRLTFEPIRALTGSDDQHGVLAKLDGAVVAIFVRLDADFHGATCGQWHHEFGFGRCDGQPGRFPSLAGAAAWLVGRLEIHPAEASAAVKRFARE